MRNDLFKTLIRHRGELATRTTFMLCDQANDAVRWMLTEAGVNLRDVLDGMVREFQSERQQSSCIQEIINVLTSEQMECPELIARKTITLSKSSLEMLNVLSRQHKINRDMLVNRIILHSRKCLEDVIVSEREHQKQIACFFDEWAQIGLDKAEDFSLLLESEPSLRDSLLNDLKKFKEIIDEAKRSIEHSTRETTSIRTASEATSTTPDNSHSNTHGNAQ